MARERRQLDKSKTTELQICIGHANNSHEIKFVTNFDCLCTIKCVLISYLYFCVLSPITAGWFIFGSCPECFQVSFSAHLHFQRLFTSSQPRPYEYFYEEKSPGLHDLVCVFSPITAD